MSLSEVHAAIPHREPFLLVDEIVECQPERIVCRKHFTGAETFYAGHYPGQPLTPGVLLCEAALQAGAVLLSRLATASPGSVPVVTRIDGVRFKQMVRPGDTVQIEVDLVERLANAYFLKGKVTRDGLVAVRLDFAVTLARPEE